MYKTHGQQLITRSHRELIVWRRAMELCVAIYQVTRSFPREKLYGLTNQLRRASVSIPSNIAEGYGRRTREQYKYFLGIAQGSNLEVQTQLDIAKRLAFGNPSEIDNAYSLAIEVDKMLTAMFRRR